MTVGVVQTAQSGIVTAEAVVLDVAPAGPGSRLLSALLDLMLEIQVWGLGALLAIPLSRVEGWLAAAWLIVWAALVLFGYPIVFETVTRGRTPAKMATGLRVVTVEGGPTRFRHAALRSFLGLIDFVLTLGAVAFVTAVVNGRGQRLGDLAAGTRVIRDRTGSRQARPVQFFAPLGYEAIAASLDPSGLSVDDYDEIRKVLLRVFELTPDARMWITWRVAQRLQTTHRHLVHPQLHPEAYLLCLAASYQRYHGIGPTPPAPPAWTAEPPSVGVPVGVR